MPNDPALDAPADIAPVADVSTAPVAESAPVNEVPAELTPAEVQDIQAEPQISLLAPEVVSLEQQLGIERVDILPRADNGFLVLIGPHRIEVSLEELRASGDIVGIIREKYQALLPK